MANYATLKAAIQDVIKTNGNNEITGALLQQSLLAMINSLGGYYQFAGVATPSTNPGTPDQNVFYLASTAGTYSNFGSIVIAENEAAILKYNGTWSKDSSGFATSEKVGQLEAEVDGLFSGPVSLGDIKYGRITVDTWTNRSSLGHYMIRVFPGQKYTLSTNTGGGTNYAVLSEYPTYDYGVYDAPSDGPVFSTDPNFSGLLNCPLNSSVEFIIPSDGVCLYIYCENVAGLFRNGKIDDILDPIRDKIDELDWSEVTGKGNALSEKYIYNLIPGHTYRMYIKNPNYDMSGVTISGVARMSISDSANNRLAYVPVGNSLESFYDFTVPSTNNEYIRIVFRATSGVSVFINIVDVTSIIDVANGVKTKASFTSSSPSAYEWVKKTYVTAESSWYGSNTRLACMLPFFVVPDSPIEIKVKTGYQFRFLQFPYIPLDASYPAVEAISISDWTTEDINIVLDSNTQRVAILIGHLEETDILVSESVNAIDTISVFQVGYLDIQGADKLYERKEVLASQFAGISAKLNEHSNILYPQEGTIVPLGTHRNGRIDMTAQAGWVNRSMLGHYMIPVIRGVEYKINIPESQYNYDFAFLKTEPTYTNNGIRPESYPDMATGYAAPIPLSKGEHFISAPYDAHWMYIQVTASMADPALYVSEGLISRVNKVTKNDTNAFYYGQKVSLNKKGFNIKEFANVYNGGHQGGAIYGDKLFLCLATGTVVVYDLVNKVSLGSFALGTALHCNAVFFGEKYDENDAFPLLFVNSYNDGIQKGTIYGYRITEVGGVYSCTLVQTIHIGFTTSSVWTDGPSDTRTYGNFVLDKGRRILYAYTLLDTTNVTRFFAFTMPTPNAGDVELEETDILYRFDIARLPYIQDSCFVNDYIFVESGYGTTGNPGLINVVSTISRDLIAQINLDENSLPMEPEFIDYYDGGLLFGVGKAYLATF